MFNRKAKKIKELKEALDVYEQVAYDAAKDNESKDKEIVKLMDDYRKLSLQLSELKKEKEKNENTISELRNKLNKNRLISVSLKKENSVLKAQIEHTKQVNRDRQKRFREAHKKLDK